MELWLLRPAPKYADPKYRDKTNPWEPWWDKSFGFVVRAETPERAREFAASRAGDEDRIYGNVRQSESPPKSVWLDPEYTTCENLYKNLVPIGEEGIVLHDFHAA